jgi:hypothetical protein
MSDITVIEPSSSSSESSGQWTPSVGHRLMTLIGAVQDPEIAKRQEGDAIRVLRKCINPRSGISTKSGSQLILGQVQSGKTSNMKTVMALAVDNGFSIFIILTGTTRILDSQTSKDMKKSLRDETPWFAFHDFAPESNSFRTEKNAEKILEAAKDWYLKGRFSDSGHKRPLCIFLLKRPDTMDSFMDTISANHELVAGIPTLIIDDEADQAGANTRTEQNRSRTNEAIGRLRQLFDRHSYLLYTATPQAPLLAELTNDLSPDLPTVLQPGAGYVGVGELFPEVEPILEERFAHEIPDSDLQIIRNKSTREVPKTLQNALAAFIVRSIFAVREPFDLTFTVMLVNTSQNTKPMKNAERWINDLVDAWKRVFKSPEDIAFSNIWDHYFRPEIESVRRSISGEEGFTGLSDSSIREEVLEVLKLLNTHVINSKNPGSDLEDDDFYNHTHWILIGGNKLSRGFRVPNLLVTYMPRDNISGESNLDTIQQRGRFFGYRSNYRALLKGWFSTAIIDAYKVYRDHDRHLRAEMEIVEANGTPLKEWLREIFSNPGLSPTRRSVVKLFLRDHSFTPGKPCFVQSGMYANTVLSNVERNLQLVTALTVGCKINDGASAIRSSERAVDSICIQTDFHTFVKFLFEYANGISAEDADNLFSVASHLSAFEQIVLEENMQGPGRLLPKVNLFFYHAKIDSSQVSNFVQGMVDRGTQFGVPYRTDSRTTGFFSGSRYEFANVSSEIYCEVIRYNLHGGAVKNGATPDELVAVGVPAIRISLPDLVVNRRLTQTGS